MTGRVRMVSGPDQLGSQTGPHLSACYNLSTTQVVVTSEGGWTSS